MYNNEPIEETLIALVYPNVYRSLKELYFDIGSLAPAMPATWPNTIANYVVEHNLDIGKFFTAFCEDVSIAEVPMIRIVLHRKKPIRVSNAFMNRTLHITCPDWA